MTIRIAIPFHVQRHGQRRQLHSGESPTSPPVPSGRVPRVAKLMALAIRFEGLIRTGDVPDYATLARLGHVTRARMTQIMNLLLLAPRIQEDILFLPPVQEGRDPIGLRHLQPITLTPRWRDQERLWRALRSRCSDSNGCA